MKNLMKEYISKVPLPEEVKEGIRSRSSMLSATLKTIPEEDLIQEGFLVVYDILQHKPNAPLLYIMKAINNHYADIREKEVLRKKIRVAPISDSTERELDNMSYRTFQKTKKEDTKPGYVLQGSNSGLFRSIVMLKDQGKSFKEIAEYLGKDPTTIRRILRKYGKRE